MNEAEQQSVKIIKDVEGDIYLLCMKKVLLYFTYRIWEIIIKKLSCSLKYSKTHVNYPIIETQHT